MRSSRLVNILILAALCASNSAGAASTAPVLPTVPAAQPHHKVHKTTQRHLHKSSSHRYGAAFVPPPPASMPAILPEIVARRMHAQDTDTDAGDTDDQKPENPYSQYIHTPDGDAPTPIDSRKGVVIWNHRS